MGSRSTLALALSASALLNSAHARQADEDPRVAAALSEARRAAGELTDTIRGLLQDELKKGGYEGAVRVCSEAAQRLTHEFRGRTGRDVRRVSLKPRNPADAPDDFERRVLGDFDRARTERRLPVETFEVVREDRREVLRYMRPLVTAPLCLNCHGGAGDVPAAVATLLKEKYPSDPATGYQVGDVRGAVSVKIALPPLEH